MRSLDEKNGRKAPFLPPTAGKSFNSARLCTAFATGMAAWSVHRDGGNSPVLKPQFGGGRNAPYNLSDATNGVTRPLGAHAVFMPWAWCRDWTLVPGPRRTGFLTGPAGHDPTGMD